MKRALLTLFGASLLALAAPAAAADPKPAVEPWSDADIPEARRIALGDFGFRPGAEYRAQFVYINPISLNTENAREVSYIEHRLRLDLGFDWKDKIHIVTSTDVLDGVMWGDNGSYGGDPSSNAGTNVNVKNPNVARPCVALRPGADPVDPQSYGYAVCSADLFKIRKLYADVVLPFGLLRVGRQPANLGSGIQNMDGDGRPNRWGVSHTGQFADRILFATKPLEALKPPARRSLSANEGLIVAVAYDRWVTDDPTNLGAAVNQWDTALRFGMPRWAGGRDLLISAYHAYRWDGQFGTKINSLGLRAFSHLGDDFQLGFEMVTNVGSTKELAAAYKVITNDPIPKDGQPVRAVGARAVARYDHRYFSLYLEGDYASGDDDPNAGTPLTAFTFSEDANIGLLMFKQSLAFQTARASAAGVTVLQHLGAPSIPAEAVATRGAFTNAVAIFPQIDVRPVQTRQHSLLLRAGALVAWAPAKVIDPIASLQRRDGLTIQDDLVNFAGGKPGNFYGAEIDGRIQYRFLDHFLLDLEGAVLFPGDAFRNQDGYAVRSGLFQARTTFYL